MKHLTLTLLLALLHPLSGFARQPLKIFILAGQSNMQGHAHVRTFARLALDPESAPLLAEMQNPDGSPKVCERTWISSLGCAPEEQTGQLTVGFGDSSRPAGGPKIGPEFTFGLAMEKALPGPILLIKTSWGGKSLHTDFRPPGAGPYVFPEKQLQNLHSQGKDLEALKAAKTAETGVYYRLMLEHVHRVLADLKRVVPEYDPALGYELAGFVWFQGWNDMVDQGTYPDRDKPGGYAAYSEVMAQFIRDVRSDLKAPRLPFVIGVLGVGGPVAEYGPESQRYAAVHTHFRDAMAAPASLPEFQGTVAAVRTEKCWDREVSNAKAKEEALRQRIKKHAAQTKLTPGEERAEFERLRTSELSERERNLLETGISNFEFHYLGSAKILGGIGKELAGAMTQLLGGTAPAPR